MSKLKNKIQDGKLPRGGKRIGAGRPQIKINWEIVDGLCKIQCTQTEIMAFINIGKHTLYNACLRDHKVEFNTYYSQKSEGGKCSLRRMQWKAAEKENAALLIFLGKQYLGQSDKIEASGKGGGPLVGVVNVFFGEESKPNAENPES